MNEAEQLLFEQPHGWYDNQELIDCELFHLRQAIDLDFS